MVAYWKIAARVVAGVIICSAGAPGQVVIDTVTVRNPGNTAEPSGSSAGGSGLDRDCGAVSYIFDIGRFEVSAAQYTEFLNAVAATDAYGLYDPLMWTDSGGCKIEQLGSPGSLTYTVAADYADRPVNWVSWGDAARFANWLHNGQPTGTQDLTTTEDGSYFLDGATSNLDLLAVVREPDATWVIPTEDEWYKAAYHMNDGATGNYFDYPTASDSIPANDLINPDPGNNANFFDGDETLGFPYFRNDVGDFENSASPYGTFDQGGNVREWTEEVLFGSKRLFRGGAYNTPGNTLSAAFRDDSDSPSFPSSSVGFRLVELPGPTLPAVSDWGVVTLLLLLLTAGTLIGTRRSLMID